MKQTVDILGIPFYNVSQNAFVDELFQLAIDEKRRFVVTANPEIVMHAQQDFEFNQIILQADYIVADGIGIVKAAKNIGKPLNGRVTGYDTMLGLLQKANEKKDANIFYWCKAKCYRKIS